MRKEPKPRNAHAVSARFRKAGAHTSTDKKRGGKRGPSKASGIIDEQLEEHNKDRRQLEMDYGDRD